MHVFRGALPLPGPPGLPMELKFSDQELAARVITICQNELNVKDHRQLPRKELLRLC
jgi:hypothetical protein